MTITTVRFLYFDLKIAFTFAWLDSIKLKRSMEAGRESVPSLVFWKNIFNSDTCHSSLTLLVSSLFIVSPNIPKGSVASFTCVNFCKW